MELIKPSLQFIESYKSALAEFEREGISGFWKFFGPVDDAEEYLWNIKRYQHRGGLPDDLVPGDASGSCARLGLDEAFLTESKDKLKERFGLVLAQFS